MVPSALDSFDNVVIMKAGKSVGKILALMRERGISGDCATVISNVGMPEEYIGKADPDREYGYFTTVIVKKNGSGRN